MVEFASNTGDICSRMRRWEPVRFGPVYKPADHFELWASLEKSKPQIIKHSKKTLNLVKGNPGKALMSILALGTIALLSSSDGLKV